MKIIDLENLCTLALKARTSAKTPVLAWKYWELAHVLGRIIELEIIELNPPKDPIGEQWKKINDSIDDLERRTKGLDPETRMGRPVLRLIAENADKRIEARAENWLKDPEIRANIVAKAPHLPT